MRFIRRDEKIFVVTTWGALLRVNLYNRRRTLFLVRDPNENDAGQYIGSGDVKILIRVRKKIGQA